MNPASCQTEMNGRLIARRADKLGVDYAVVARCIEVYQPRFAAKTLTFIERAGGSIFWLPGGIDIDALPAGCPDLRFSGLKECTTKASALEIGIDCDPIQVETCGGAGNRAIGSVANDLVMDFGEHKVV